MYKSILLPIDLDRSDSRELTLPKALELANTFGAVLHLVAVVPAIGSGLVGTFLPSDFESKALERASQLLHAFAEANIPASIRGKAHIAHGTVREEIVKAADTLGCDLIIMAPHRPEMADFLISPNTEYVAARANVSVLVVRDKVAA